MPSYEQPDFAETSGFCPIPAVNSVHLFKIKRYDCTGADVSLQYCLKDESPRKGVLRFELVDDEVEGVVR